MTDAQQTRFQQCTNLLMWHIEAWQQVQVFFMPGVSGLQNEWAKLTNRPYSPEDVPLFLPSQITSKAVCPCMLEMIEFRLREGQAHDALNDLRQGLRSHAYMLKFKDRFLCGQGANTWARNCLKALNAKINATAARYRIVYHAVNTLSPLLVQVGWKDKLHPLADEDIRVLSSRFDLQPGEGRCWVSWIWWVCGYGEQATENKSDDGFQEGKWPSTYLSLILILSCISNLCGMVQGTHTCTSLARGGYSLVRRNAASITVSQLAH